ncbi:MAG TPA: hypothetical protein VH877_09990 [Polyangia bacterium]|jgi:hypothetical protein|nr:hypothetical protein [Polyangia bacterium]
MSVLLGACSGGTGGASGALDVQSTGNSLKGTYTADGSTVKFSSTETAPGVFDVTVDVHGATLGALIDRNHEVAEVDGFAGAGADTQIVEADRQVLGRFVRALDEQLDTDHVAAASILSRLASNWSQTPDSVPLQRQVAGGENRGWTSLCSSYRTYVTATHDDNNYSRNSPKTTSYADVGQRTSSTYYYVNGVWTTTTQNHVAYLYERGDCYGNCGPDCPSTVQTLTRDCHDHDQCVRNGHAIASIYCDDEFTSASDDELFAPRCSGT